MTAPAQHPFDLVLAERFSGLLRHGSHAPDGLACALEAATVARGREWSDSPEYAGLPDLRALNDGPWTSDAKRTEAMLPLIRALWDWPDWSDDRRIAWTQRVALRTVTEVLPLALDAAGLPGSAESCRAAKDLSAAARVAARVAARFVAWDVAVAAEAAAWAAGAAAVAAAWATARDVAVAAGVAARVVGVADDILSLSCAIMSEEAERG